MIGRGLEFLIVGVLARIFPSRYRLIPRAQDGRPLLRQFKIFATRELRPGRPRWHHVGIYLQSFAGPEVLERFHVHRWRHMLSFVLSGSFLEERYPGGFYESHHAPDAYTMTDTTIHRFAWVAPRTWTLFIMLGQSRWKTATGWGYYPRPESLTAGYTPWDREIPEGRRVKSL